MTPDIVDRWIKNERSFFPEVRACIEVLTFLPVTSQFSQLSTHFPGCLLIGTYLFALQ
jgi:hypothetical protein